jgi:hypothetical protein
MTISLPRRNFIQTVRALMSSVLFFSNEGLAAAAKQASAASRPRNIVLWYTEPACRATIGPTLVR